MPTTLVPDHSCSSPYSNIGSIGSNCAGSELGHLFYDELGGTYGESIFDTGNENVALFSNLDLPSHLLGYWSGSCCDVNGGVVNSVTGEVYDPEDFAYYLYRFDNGYVDPLYGYGSDNAGGQNSGPKLNSDAWVPWIVRNGDVVSVPEPGTAGLMLSGMLLLGLRPRRRVPKE